jgi:glutamate racemase
MTNSDKSFLPIAIFDSGVGGLTVARALKQRLPNESLFYLADTASRPFGTKSAHELKVIIEKNCELLASLKIKMLVIACHTACSLGLEIYRPLNIPIMGITESSFSTLQSLNIKQSKMILGTERTIRSGVYQEFLRSQHQDQNTIFYPCSFIERMIETEASDPELILKEMKASLHEISLTKNAQVLLACTHFPIYSSYIKKALDPSSTLIDPAFDFALAIANKLKSLSLTNSLAFYEDHYLVTHDLDSFKKKFFSYFSETLGKTNHFFNHSCAII